MTNLFNSNNLRFWIGYMIQVLRLSHDLNIQICVGISFFFDFGKIETAKRYDFRELKARNYESISATTGELVNRGLRL